MDQEKNQSKLFTGKPIIQSVCVSVCLSHTHAHTNNHMKKYSTLQIRKIQMKTKYHFHTANKQK